METLAAVINQPLSDTEAGGRALVADTEIHLEALSPGIKVWRRDDAGSSTFLGWLKGAAFDSIADVLGSSQPFNEGLVIMSRDGARFTVAASTADDHDLTTSGGAKLYVDDFGGAFRPAMYGVVEGSGQTPEVGQQNVERLNKMMDRAALLGRKVYFPAGATIEIANATSPLKIPSKISVEGNRCIIQAQDDTGQIIVSKSWADNLTPGGNGHVDGLIARGTLTDAEIFTTGVGAPNSQDGFIVFDYFSRWTNCEAWRCRGRGFVAMESNSAGTPPAGTLVENIFDHCRARNCAGRGFDMAPNQLGKLTDGFLLNPIVGQPKGCTREAIYLGQGSGWNLRGYHTYAGSPERAVVVSRGYQTNLGDGYIETYTRNALYLPEAQQNVSVGNIGVRSNVASHANAAVVEVERSSAVPTANITIQSIQDENMDGGAHLLIRNLFNLTLPVSLGSYQVKGDNAALVTLPTAADAWLSMPSQGVVIGRFTDVVSQAELSYQGVQLMKGAQIQWSGGGAKTLTFSIPYLTLYHMNRKMVCDLTIFSAEGHTGPDRAAYTAKLFISGAFGGGAFKFKLQETSTPAGFDVLPAIGAVTKTGTQSGVNPVGVDFQITFTPTDADGLSQGIASLLLGPTLGL
jgi:hypothetical protein